VRYEIGNGSKVLFWHDVWCGEIPLKTLFSELFLIASGKDTWMEKNIQRQNGTILWNICFLAQFMIGRWKRLVDFWGCCTLLKLEARERIKCVRFQRVRNHLS